jgi:hypothetical protein
VMSCPQGHCFGVRPPQKRSWFLSRNSGNRSLAGCPLGPARQQVPWNHRCDFRRAGARQASGPY